MNDKVGCEWNEGWVDGVDRLFDIISIYNL